MKRLTAWTVIVLLFSTTKGHAQFSAFASATYGYHTNPLYNFESLPDQVKQSYLQLMYAPEVGPSPLVLTYINAMAFFNRFAERNYFDHSLQGSYGLKFGGKTADGTRLEQEEPQEDPDDTTSSNSDGSSIIQADPKEEQISSDEDSSGVHLGLGFKISNRVDKIAYNEFDNFGGEQVSSFRIKIGESLVLRFGNTFGYRSYTYIPELSNLHEVLSVQVRNAPTSVLGFGVNLGGGIKHFTYNAIDTSKFESVRSYIVKPPGHGKPGGKVKSTKQLLANSGTTTSSQFFAGLFVEKKWKETTLTCDVLVRVNSKTPPRYLAQSTSGLNQDIYNDQFSYSGWETRLTVNQSLPAGFKANAVLEFQRKRYGAAAYNLSGDQIGKNRLDLHTSGEMTFSKSISLFEGVDVELLLFGGLLRNQSNDEYSDFSALNVAFGFGVGF